MNNLTANKTITGSRRQLLATLHKLPSPDSYLVAYSGGLDSHVLLHMLSGLQDQLKTPIHAIHIQHGLQAEAEQWAGHCLAICQALQIPCTVQHLHLKPQPGVSLEALARNARYAAFAQALPDRGMLLTAHQADDQAETFLLQLLRGAGITGLAAMPGCREWHQGWHARPLLTCNRAELAQYAKQHQLRWIEDPSNQNTNFDRNYLRQRVMPLIKARWPAASTTISRSAGHLADVLPLLQIQTDQALEQCLNPEGHLSISQLAALDGVMQNRLLRAWIQQAGHPTPQQAHLTQIQQHVLDANNDATPEVCWGNSVIRRYRDELWLMSNTRYPLPETPVDWPDTPELSLPPGCGRLLRKPSTKTGIPDRLWRQGRITVRWRTQGLKCQPLGREGHRSFKKLCQDFAIPPWQRPYLPLVYADDLLVTVADYCVCTRVEIQPEDTFSCLVYKSAISWSSTSKP